MRSIGMQAITSCFEISLKVLLNKAYCQDLKKDGR